MPELVEDFRVGEGNRTFFTSVEITVSVVSKGRKDLGSGRKKEGSSYCISKIKLFLVE